MLGNSYISIAIYVLLILLFNFLISRCKQINNTKYILFLYVIVLSFLSFNYKPLTDVDLTRLQKTLILYKNYNFIDILYKIPNTVDFTRLVYFWMISKTGINDLLQVGATLTFYSINFYIIYDFCKNHNVSPKVMGKVFSFFMILGQFIFVISGIRTAMSFAIFHICYYRETFKNKSMFSNLPLYLISIGMHSASITVFLLRIILSLFEKNEHRKNNIFFNYITVAIIVATIFLFGKEIINSFLFKYNEYTNNGAYYNKPEYLLAVLKNILFMFIMFMFYKKKKNINLFSKLKQYNRIVLFLFIIIIIFSFQYTIFTRYTYLVEIMLLPTVITELDYYSNIKLQNRFSIQFFMLIFYIMLFLIFVLGFSKANMSIFNLF